MLNEINNRLFPVLLKNTENISFGVNLMHIITPKKQGEVVVKTKTLLVTDDNLEYDPVDCQSVEIKFEGDNIILNVVLAEDNEEQQTENVPQTENMPQTEAVVPTSKTDTFMLQGDDLEAFELLSDFRHEENRGQKTENDKLAAYTLESGTFDIQDLTSVQNAMLDIVEKEKQYIDQGYKVFKIHTPRFDYENSSNFKLVESVVLIKQAIPATEIVEENK